MRARLVAASGLATVLATGSTALAAAPWSEPRDVSATFLRLSQPTIGFGTDGTAVLTWVEHTPTRSEGDILRTRFASLRLDASVVDHGTLPAGPSVPAVGAVPAVYGRDRTVVLRVRRRDATTGGTRVRIDALFGTTARPLGGRFRRVAAFRSIGDWEGPALAAAGNGEVAVAWTEFRQGPPRREGMSEHRVRVAFGRAGRGFGRPRTLAVFPELERDSHSAALAYGPRNDLVMAYSIGRRTERGRMRVAARVRRPGRSFGRAQVLGTRLENSRIAAAVGRSGRAVVVWGSQDGGEEVHSPWVVRAAIRSAAGRFGRAVVIDPGDGQFGAPKDLSVAVAADGSATAVWTNDRDVDGLPLYPVRTATASPTGGFGLITQLAVTGLAAPVVAAPDGTALVTWTDMTPGWEFFGPQSADILTALRPPGAAAPAAPESAFSGALHDFPAATAFDPRTGRPTMVWVTADDAGSARIQLSTRTG